LLFCSSTSTYVALSASAQDIWVDWSFGVSANDIQIAERIRHRVETYTAAFPSLLEIPSKDHPYDPEKDSVLKRVRRLFGE
jgi:vacuolar-type H+-ATPase subunit F/Vma7